MLTKYFVPVFLISLQCVRAELSLQELTLSLANIPEDGRLEFCPLLKKYNYPCVRYQVITKDGYNLTMFNIPGDKRKPVLMQHGFVDSSFTWVIRGHNSLAAWLSNNTFDLWLANTRGNMLSRAHTTLNPDHLKFWDFSFHEMALYDVPATIDFILEKTGQKKLQVISHSQGTSLFFVLGAVKPEYESKIKNVICLAPIAYLNHAESPFFPLISLVGGPLLSAAVGFIGKGEFLSNSSELVTLFRTACTQGLVGYEVCGVGGVAVLAGADPAQFGREFAPIAFGHYPSGSSMKNAVHLLQIVASKRYQQYDYGIGNLAKYGSIQPPIYDLSKVPFTISLFVGRNDRLSAIKDVKRLRRGLTHANHVDYYVMPYKKWNHVDFVWGEFMNDYLFIPVVETLNKYYN